MAEPGAGQGALDDGFGAVVAEPLNRLRQVGARRLHAAWSQIPHVTHHDSVDATAAEEHRVALQASSGQKASLLPFIAAATIRALLRWPRFCASYDAEGQRLLLKQYVNLGLAVETPLGLVVGVLHGVGSATPASLAPAIVDLASRARAGKLKPTEMEGACFTISSLGSIGGTAFTPIINPPNVAILGVARASLQPVWVDGQFSPRLLVPLSLSYDHRVIDGAEAARFCNSIAEALADPAGAT